MATQTSDQLASKRCAACEGDYIEDDDEGDYDWDEDEEVF